MLVPASEITVIFSIPGFLLLGRQDVRGLLSPEALNLSLILILDVSVDATGSWCCDKVSSPCTMHGVPLNKLYFTAQVMLVLYMFFSIFTHYSM